MKKYLFSVLMMLPLFSFSQGSTYSFSNVGTSAVMDTALNYTGRLWGKFLNSNVPIKVNIYYTNLGAASNLAITIPNGRKDFLNAPSDSVWYPTALANSLAMTELNPGESDMDIYVNSNVNWYLDTLGNPGSGQYDFVTVILHEMGHGLGFLSLAKLDGSQNGSFGMVTAADIAPLTSSFPFPVLEGLPSTFALFMENGNGDALVDTVLFPNNSTILGSEFVSNDLYFDGTQTRNYNSGLPARIYAPTTYSSGSSTQHLNEMTFPASNVNSLMTPFINVQEVHHHPGDLTVAMLEDIGWNVNYIASVDEHENLSFTFYPNPAKDFLQIHSELTQGSIFISDISGRRVLEKAFTMQSQILLDLSSLTSGTYLIELIGEQGHFTSKLIIE